MHRFYLSPNDWSDPLRLTGGEAHHARDVLRLEAGAQVAVFDGRGREATAEIIRSDASSIQLRVVQTKTSPPLACRTTLAQAIPKGKKMELIIQKAVEIGASEIVPLVSARTIVRIDAENAAQKQAKWQLVALEAAKQCGQNWLPQVHAPRAFEEFFAGAAEFDLRLIGSLQPGARHLKKILADYQEAQGGARPLNVLIVIGPEGDFTPAELALARSHGCTPLTLGPIILRVETAAIYCLSILSYELF